MPFIPNIHNKFIPVWPATDIENPEADVALEDTLRGMRHGHQSPYSGWLTVSGNVTNIRGWVRTKVREIMKRGWRIRDLIILDNGEMAASRKAAVYIHVIIDKDGEVKGYVGQTSDARVRHMGHQNPEIHAKSPRSLHYKAMKDCRADFWIILANCPPETDNNTLQNVNVTEMWMAMWLQTLQPYLLSSYQTSSTLSLGPWDTNLTSPLSQFNVSSGVNPAGRVKALRSTILALKRPNNFSDIASTSNPGIMAAWLTACATRGAKASRAKSDKLLQKAQET